MGELHEKLISDLAGGVVFIDLLIELQNRLASGDRFLKIVLDQFLFCQHILVGFLRQEFGKGILIRPQAVSNPAQLQLNDLFQITPLLILEIIVLAVVIWLVSFVSVTLPYRNAELINEKSIFESATIQEKIINALSFYPIRVQTNKSTEEGFTPAPTVETQATEASTESQDATSATTNNVPGPQLAETTIPEISATSG